jgi:hypothetical protein
MSIEPCFNALTLTKQGISKLAHLLLYVKSVARHTQLTP